jgi:hypothetical protein
MREERSCDQRKKKKRESGPEEEERKEEREEEKRVGVREKREKKTNLGLDCGHVSGGEGGGDAHP